MGWDGKGSNPHFMGLNQFRVQQNRKLFKFETSIIVNIPYLGERPGTQ